MSTTTIRIDDALKARMAEAAQRAGKTAHSFILEAIAQTVAQSEQDQALQALADGRWGTLLATQQTVGWDEIKAYLRQRAQSGAAVKPPAGTFSPTSDKE